MFKVRKSFFLFLILFFIFSVKTEAVTSVEQAVLDRESELKEELANVEEEIEAQQKILTEKQKESASIERDVAILNAQIESAKLTIKSKNITIERLGKDIGVKSETIEDLSEKLIREKESLAQLIRKTNEIDSLSVAEMVLSNGDLSNFFSDLDSFATLQISLKQSSDDIRNVREKTETEKDYLNQKKQEETDARAVIEEQKKKIEKAESDKKQLLAISKNQEKGYQAIISERQKRASEIRSALFSLRDSAAIPFGTALSYATEAEKKTGVRPAFLLAILTQETNLGENIGTCNRPQDPPSKHWKEIMKPSRDQSPYLLITQKLGFDPDSMPLSCPWNGGWGGAMGPSQFIPSTWVAFASKISKALGLGNSYPNPWNPEHAFMASSIYLGELGAGRGGFSAEREAALRYYAGGAWNNPKNAFYGNQVMARAQSIQANMIDPLLDL